MRKNEFSCDCSAVCEKTVCEVKDKMLSDEVFLKASTFLKILGDPTRIKIIYALNQSKMCVCDIANVLNLSKSATSHQLALLRKNDLVKFEKLGKVVYYELCDEHVKDMLLSSVKHANE